jgi:hypothetical protein
MTSSPAFKAAVTRDTILNVLSDAEVAKVSTVEGGPVSGEYVDLEHLELGVQSGSAGVDSANLLAKSAVSPESWKKIVAMLE